MSPTLEGGTGDVRDLHGGRRLLGHGLMVVVLVASVGMVLSLQGWRSHPPAFDMLTYFRSAQTLLSTGSPARYGDISSYGAFAPPGTTWLLAPGLLLFHDPRLYEKAGAAVLFLVTLLGVFLVARAAFGVKCAHVSVVLYGFSNLGLSFAGSLWPIGHPAFYVWMTFASQQWVVHRNAKYLAGALLVWALGMYVDMAITPAVLALPAVWLAYRAPLASKYHFVAVGLALAVWYPYLQFERRRELIDLRSLLLLQNIFPANYRQGWCDQGLKLEQSVWPDSTWPDTGASTQQVPINRDLLARVAQRARRVAGGFLATPNPGSSTPAVNVVVSLCVLSVLVLLGYGALNRSRLLESRHPRDPMGNTDPPQRIASGCYVLCLAVPWIILLLVAEAGRPERFFWIWPLQAIALAGCITDVLPALRIPKPVVWLSQLVLAALVLVPGLQGPLERWLREGWAGSDPEEVRVVDYLATQIGPGHHSSTAVGYQLFIYPFMANYHVLDPIYKVGAELDLLLETRHGIMNADRCAEGAFPNDQYRVVQTHPRPAADEPRHYFALPAENHLRLLRRFDSYEVFKRE